ncbi:MAG: 5-formyltetrahydrofolate cyclo-ligase [Coriobacteriia bacterium]|nr:5-formyltetrahydrofolate cyclo-ligase [Coriobacteriia bacterium]
MLTKSELRKDALARRRSYDGDARTRAAKQLSLQLLSLPVLRSARTISAYVPFGGEINILPTLCDLLTAPDTSLERILMPRVSGTDTLTMHLCDPSLFCGNHAGKSFIEGYGGILEPEEEWPIVAFSEADVVIIPGVAFDRRRKRIGYGRGFFDRMLPAKGGTATAIGVIFDDLLYDELPCEDHDVAMDIVVSPSEIV